MSDRPTFDPEAMNAAIAEMTAAAEKMATAAREATEKISEALAAIPGQVDAAVAQIVPPPMNRAQRRAHAKAAGHFGRRRRHHRGVR